MSTTDSEPLRCPECEKFREGRLGDIPGTVEDETIIVEFDCPKCDAALELLLESALPEAIGIDIDVQSAGARE
jgi:hypothetical protein